jgi:hypothetical protein
VVEALLFKRWNSSYSHKTFRNPVGAPQVSHTILLVWIPTQKITDSKSPILHRWPTTFDKEDLPHINRRIIHPNLLKKTAGEVP